MLKLFYFWEKIFLSLFFLALTSTPLYALERGIQVRANLEKASGMTIGTYRALIIGINDYRDNRIPKLKTAVNDARELAEILKKNYGFKDVTLLLDENAGESKIIKELRRLVAQSSKNDSVLVYYAGHGELDRLTGSGWWIPYNAIAQDPSTYIDNSVIQKYIKSIPARHVLLVADSCFSGTLFGEARSLPKVIDDKWYATLYKKRSRWGMTSGNLTPVSDSGSEGHSVFAYQFLETLKENQKPYLTPREIYALIGPIIRNNSEQMPITKPIRNADDQGGEFIFIRMEPLAATEPSITEAVPEPSPLPQPEIGKGALFLEEPFAQGIGDIFIESDPSGAIVYLDGKLKGGTPLELNEVPSGRHRIELKKDKIYFAKLEIDLKAGDFIKRKVKLQRAKGKVKISSYPSGAKIYIDGQDTGKTTPDLISTEAGEHELKLEGLTTKGRVIYEGKIMVEPNRRVSVTITDFEERRAKSIEEKMSIKEMVLVKGGCFEMGDIFGDGGSDEKPVHNVCVDDFYLGEHEVTQKEWKDIMGNNPSRFKNCGDDCPVEFVSWRDVQGFIKKLNRKSGMQYRLPTEAEWEYAARSKGKREKWPGSSNESELGDYAWYESNSGGKTSPVKQKLPNELGLYDMSGNVWEWIADWHRGDYYRERPATDNPKGPPSGKYRVLRGGSWNNVPWDIRSAYRAWNSPGRRNNNEGFRLAVSLNK